MQRALDENSVIVAQMTPFFGDEDDDATVHNHQHLHPARRSATLSRSCDRGLP
jgi:hypothetical protein